MTTAWPHLGAAGTHFATGATPNPSSGRLAVAWPTSPSSTPSCARSWIVRPPRLSGAVAHSKSRFGTSCASSGTRGAKSAAPLERARSTRGPAGAAAAAGRAANAHHFRPRSCTHAHRARAMHLRTIVSRAAAACLLATPTLLPEGVLSTEREDTQAVNSS